MQVKCIKGQTKTDRFFYYGTLEALGGIPVALKNLMCSIKNKYLFDNGRKAKDLFTCATV